MGAEAASLETRAPDSSAHGIRIFAAWFAALAWAGFVWGLGSDPFSMSETSRILGPLLDWIAPGLDSATRARALAGLRKLAHVFEYGVLALLAGRAIALALRARMRWIAAAALALVAGLAAADEGRQARSAVRTGAASDVALDVAGGALAIAAWLALKRARGLPLFERDASERSRR